MDRLESSERTWVPASSVGKLELPLWSDALRDVDPEVLINSASTGLSFWDGHVPDPIDPGGA